MSILANIRVRTKIIGVIGILGLMVLGGSYFTAGHMRQIDNNYTVLLEKDALSWVNSARVAKNISDARYSLLRLADNSLSAENKTSMGQRLNDELTEAVSLSTSVKKLSPAFASQADGIAARIVSLRQTATQVIGLALAMKETQARDLLADAASVFDQLSIDADQLRADLSKAIKKGSDGLTETTDSTIQMIWTLMSAIVVAGMLLGFAIAVFGITKPLAALVGTLQKVAKGEDIEVVGADRKDEIGDTARAIASVRTMIAQKTQRAAAMKAEADTIAMAEKAERDRLSANQKFEQDQRAAAERDAATAQVMADFDAAVGGIAKAVMAGDFTQHVSLEGKEGVIRNLAAAMNAMCDNIGKVMEDMVAMMGALSEGDLTRRITADYQGAFGTLKDAANTTAIRLSETMSEITASAKEVANAAAEISTSTTDLSQRTEEQAAGLEETSASMEEISATVKKNAENAHQANQLTAGAREVADRGGTVVASTVEAMSRIEESSRKIADIIGVIDEIARQTNLLALNAAVEAARAGDAGRGFAVVASEVRSLAQRSSQAAKDIKDLITNSSTQVKDGVDLVNRTGASLNEIVESIKRVADIVADIANASNEQATGIDQVNRALTQMDEVTQQNSALVEENAATAKTLESQSAAVSERVGFFRVDQHGSRIAPAAAASRPVVRPQTVKRGGVVGRMQAGLATALKRDEFEEF